MSLSDLAALGSFISGVAIVVSLIYAAMQFRVYAKAAHESRVIAINTDIQQFRMSLVLNPDVARIYRDGLEDLGKLESIDQWRFGALMQTLIGNFALGIEFKDVQDPTDVESSLRWILNRPGARSWWPKARHIFSDTVRVAIDKAIDEGHAHSSTEAASAVPK